MSAFFSPYRHEFVRVGACVPQVAVAEPAKNGDQVLELLAKGAKAGLALMVFPELCLSAYAIDDLLFQDAVLDGVVGQIARLLTASKKLSPVFVVGAPLRWRGRLYNCGIVIHRGRLLGIVPKVFLPNYREFYERRHFTSGEGVRDAMIALAGQEAPFGIDLLFAAGGPNEFIFHVEICEDLWVPQPPSALGAAAGAEILLNLSASNIVIGKAQMRRLLCASQSARCLAAYAYSAAGAGESTTDLAWDGQAGIFEIGDMLAETERFSATPQMAVADVDVGRIRQERMRMNTFGDNARLIGEASPPFRRVEFDFAAPSGDLELHRRVERFPFVPADPAMLADNCYEAYNIQVQGLSQRLAATGLKKLVIGVSGGLDSTQALIVSARVPERLVAEDSEPAPDSCCRGERRCQSGHRRGVARYSRDRDLAGTGARRRGRRDPVDREHCRPLCVAGFQSVLCDPLWLRAVEDRLSRLGCLARPEARRVAVQYPGQRAARLRTFRDQELAPRVFAAILRAEPIQALGSAERPEDLVGRLPVAAR